MGDGNEALRSGKDTPPSPYICNTRKNVRRILFFIRCSFIEREVDC